MGEIAKYATIDGGGVRGPGGRFVRLSDDDLTALCASEGHLGRCPVCGTSGRWRKRSGGRADGR